MTEVRHLETKGFYDLMLSGVILYDGKLTYAIIDERYMDVKVRLEDGEKVLDEFGDPIYDWPPVFYDLHALTPDMWEDVTERSRQWAEINAFRSDYKDAMEWLKDPRVRDFYDEKGYHEVESDYSAQPIVCRVADEDITEWAKYSDTIDWFEQNYEQHDPRNY